MSRAFFSDICVARHLPLSSKIRCKGNCRNGLLTSHIGSEDLLQNTILPVSGAGRINCLRDPMRTCKTPNNIDQITQTQQFILVFAVKSGIQKLDRPARTRSGLGERKHSPGLQIDIQSHGSIVRLRREQNALH